MYVVFFFKQKTAYEMRISDWSSDVCSSDLRIVSGPGSGVKFTLDDHTRVIIGPNSTISVDELDRKSVVQGKSVSVRVDLGGRRIIKKKKIDRKRRCRHRSVVIMRAQELTKKHIKVEKRNPDNTKKTE